MQIIDNVEKLGKRYMMQSTAIIIVLTIITISVSSFSDLDLLSPMLVSIIFALLVSIADATIWRKVAKNSPDSLPTFYTAVSGFRMLLALFTLFICYLVVGRDAMLEYCIVFMIYYFVLLVHHSVFFSHVSNSHSKCDKEK